MDQEIRNELDDLSDRITDLSEVSQSFAQDHLGWLIAVQSLSAVALSTALRESEDPQGLLSSMRADASNLVQNAVISGSSISTNEEHRAIAREKLDAFFNGISIEDSGS